jgi:hypothetical protein
VEKQYVLHVLNVCVCVCVFCVCVCVFLCVCFFVSVTLFVRHAKLMCRIMLSSVACRALPDFYILSHKRNDFRKTDIEHKMCVLIFSTAFFSEAFLIMRRIRRDILTNARTSSCKLSVLYVRL